LIAWDIPLVAGFLSVVLFGEVVHHYGSTPCGVKVAEVVPGIELEHPVMVDVDVGFRFEDQSNQHVFPSTVVV